MVFLNRVRNVAAKGVSVDAGIRNQQYQRLMRALHARLLAVISSALHRGDHA